MLRIVVGLTVLVAALPVTAQESAFTRKEDVIYARKFGTALTMDVFTPTKNANGACLIYAVSGGWFSSKESINVKSIEVLTKRGYTVFAVVHGSQPKYAIPDVLEDMHRATRFIRHHAKQYGVDGEKIGITGGSAGGHLSLMQGCAGREGNLTTKDQIDRQPSRVQAVACFFPPTDFLNYGKDGEIALGNGVLVNFRAPFDFTEFDPKSRAFNLITDEEKRKEIGKKISPYYHADKNSAPALIIHGDADKLVPIQQAERMVAALKKANIAAELVVKPGAAHGWGDMIKDVDTFADWFDKHLLKKK